MNAAFDFRALTAEDAGGFLAFVAAHAGDLQRGGMDGLAATADQYRAWQTVLARTEGIREWAFGVFRGAELVALVGVEVKPKFDAACLWYVTASAWRGQGLATYGVLQAMQACLPACLVRNGAPLKHWALHIEAANRASLSLAATLGFQRDPRLDYTAARTRSGYAMQGYRLPVSAVVLTRLLQGQTRKHEAA